VRCESDFFLFLLSIRVFRLGCWIAWFVRVQIKDYKGSGFLDLDYSAALYVIYDATIAFAEAHLSNPPRSPYYVYSIPRVPRLVLLWECLSPWRWIYARHRLCGLRLWTTSRVAGPTRNHIYIFDITVAYFESTADPSWFRMPRKGDKQDGGLETLDFEIQNTRRTLARMTIHSICTHMTCRCQLSGWVCFASINQNFVLLE
jgi:hypothetical protein